MTHVLRMCAFEFRDPSPVRVLVEADNLTDHGWFVLAGYVRYVKLGGHRNDSAPEFPIQFARRC